METPERQGPALPLSGVVVFLALLSTALYHHVPLKGSRPIASREEAELVARGAENIPARLWQDPFAAVGLYESRNAGQATSPHPSPSAQAMQAQRHTLKELQSRIKAYSTRANNGGNGNEKTLIVMGVMVFGGPYAESRERRLRSRYAVISALGRAGYSPDDSEHIGYFKPDEATYGAEKNAKQPLLPKESLLRRIPYEWFNPIQPQKPEPRPPLLLLWLDDDAFHSEPIAKLDLLIDRVRGGQAGLQFKILGPAGSTTFRAMRQELGQSNRPALSNKIEIYSPSATVADKFLPGPGRNSISPINVRNGTGGGRVHLRRTIATDKDLAESLICELRRRGINAVCSPEEGRCRNQLKRYCGQGKKTLQVSRHKGMHKDNIALVAEWDSLYGRSLPKTFTDVVRDWHCGKNDCRDSQPDWIHRFSYLRGIDGQLPGMKKDRKDQEDRPAGRVTGKTDEADRIERSEGRGQLDYLRRLSENLYVLQTGLAAKQQTIKAIGVLGSDVYDKLLILQALKKRFPRAIFLPQIWMRAWPIRPTTSGRETSS